MRGNPCANFKTACFVKYLGLLLMDFHETSITGIPLLRLKDLFYLEDLLHHPLLPAFNLHTHTHTYIYTVGSHLSYTVVKLDSNLARIFCKNFFFIFPL